MTIGRDCVGGTTNTPFAGKNQKKCMKRHALVTFALISICISRYGRHGTGSETSPPDEFTNLNNLLFGAGEK
jgi:hypothetical protein